MKTKHTPGPWRIGGHIRQIMGKGGGFDPVVATMPPWGDDRMPEQEANAWLIAAAPELLEAAYHSLDICKGIVDGIRQADPKMALQLSRGLAELERPIREAIAKAEG